MLVNSCMAMASIDNLAPTKSLIDLSNPDASAYLQDRFKNMGVDRALIRAKVKKGEIVKIGKLEFEYEEDE